MWNLVRRSVCETIGCHIPFVDDSLCDVDRQTSIFEAFKESLTTAYICALYAQSALHLHEALAASMVLSLHHGNACSLI